MQLACPNCGQNLPVPEELETKGVVRLSCVHCSYGFVLRLGQPSEENHESRDPLEPAQIDGVRSSGEAGDAAGEIGASRSAFIPAGTQTSIKLSPELWANIEPDARATGSVAPRATGAPSGEGFESFGAVDDPGVGAPSPAAVSGASAPAQIPASVQGPAPAVAAAAQQQVPAEPPVQSPAAAQSSFPMETASPLRQGPLYDQATGPVQLPLHMQYGNPLLLVDHEEYFREATDQGGRWTRIIGKLMLTCITGMLVFVLFVVFRNDWKVDFSNIDHMLDRALGRSVATEPERLRDQLELTDPLVKFHRMIDGTEVLAVTGIVRNSRGAAKRYAYVEAQLLRGRQIMARATAPAGNVFTDEQIATMDPESMHSLINPAGKNGRNAQILLNGTVAYMVVLTELPEDYKTAWMKKDRGASRAKYRVSVRVVKVEAYDAQ